VSETLNNVSRTVTLDSASGPTKHRTGPHRTAPGPKILGDGIDQTPLAYRWPRYTIPANNSSLTPLYSRVVKYTTLTIPHCSGPQTPKKDHTGHQKLGEGSPLEEYLVYPWCGKAGETPPLIFWGPVRSFLWVWGSGVITVQYGAVRCGVLSNRYRANERTD